MAAERSPRARTATRVFLAALLFGVPTAAFYGPLAAGPGLPDGGFASDLRFHLHWAHGFLRGLRDGVVYPRWIDDASYGAGAPVFVYYPPLAYYAVALVRTATPDLAAALRATLVLLALASAVSFFLALHRRYGVLAAAAGGGLYAILPYHVLDAGSRFALAEFTAFVWLPPLYACCRGLIERPSRPLLAGFALSAAALMLSHPLSAYMAALVFGIYAVWRCLEAKALAALAWLTGASTLALGLAAVYLLPLVSGRGWAQLAWVVESPLFDFRRGLLFVDEVALGFRAAPIKPWVEGSALVQSGLTLGAALAAAWLWKRVSAGGNSPGSSARIGEGAEVFRLFALGLFVFALQTVVSAPLWRHLPGLRFLQFPWRFGELQALLASLLATSGFAALCGSERRGRCGRAFAALLLGLGVTSAALWSARIVASVPRNFGSGKVRAAIARPPLVAEYLPKQLHQIGALQRWALHAPPARLRSAGSLRVLAWSSHERRIEVETPRATVLVLRTFYHPGWRARIDGAPARVLSVGTLGALGVRLPAGRHRVRIAYEGTPAERLGALASLASLAVLLLVAAWPSGKRASLARALALGLGPFLALGCRPPAAPPAGRSLVLISLDTARRDHLSVYGYERDTTPHLEAFARNAIVFDNAFAQETNTNPSHNSIFTGLYPHVHGAIGNGIPLPPGRRTVTQILRAAGFRTAAFVSGATLRRSASGLDRGFELYDDLFPGTRRTAHLTVNRALAWLGRLGPHERFFLFLHLFDAHGPYRPPARYAKLFHSDDPGPRLHDIPVYQRHLDVYGRLADHVGSYRDRYDATLRYQDDELERVLARLDPHRTVVVVLADHGETLGERFHGPDHGGQVFDEQIRIPLILRVPGSRGRRLEAYVETIDLLPTLLELLAVPLPADFPLQGRSLLPLLESRGAGREFVFASARAESDRYGDRGYTLDPGRRILSIRSRGWKLILYPGTEHDFVELYDLRADPGERQDVSKQHAKLLEALRAELERWHATRPGNAPSASGSRRALSPELREQLRALGYVE